MARANTREEIVSTLRAHQTDLRRVGIVSLSLFGSVARGDARPDSDVDVAIRIIPQRRNVKRSLILGLAFAVVFSSAGASSVKETSLRAQLVGTWRYVSVTDRHKDGTRIQSFGRNPSGIAIFQPNGLYAIVVSRRDLPKFASNSRLHGTPSENTVAERGSLGHFGAYTVNEADRTFTTRAIGATFPNIIGVDRKYIVASITKDEIVWIPLEATGGGRGRGVLRRVK
jgi:hypothetical protein